MYLSYVKGQWAYPRACSGSCFKELLIKNKLDKIEPIGDITFVTHDNPDLSMKSFYERRLAEWLVENKLEWRYEAYTFRLPVSSIQAYHYKPDFLLTDYNIFLEVKAGIWEWGAYKKVYSLAKSYPLYLITPEILGILRSDK